MGQRACSRTSLFFIFLLASMVPGGVLGAPRFQDRPKLALVVVIDQLRFDCLLPLEPYFWKAEINVLLDGGAVFTGCRSDYATIATGPGHRTLLTGACRET